MNKLSVPLTKEFIEDLGLWSRSTSASVTSNAQVTLAGKYGALKVRSRPISTAYLHAKRKKTKVEQGLKDIWNIITRAEKTRRKDNIHRAKRSLYELIRTNITSSSKFLTLTVAENMQDRQQMVAWVAEFVALLRKTHGRSFAYVYVLEQQERGAWHAHMIIFEFPFYYTNETFAQLFWKHGFVKITGTKNAKDDPDTLAGYLAKYLGKDMDNNIFIRAYSRSQFLKSPIKLYDKDSINDLLQEMLAKNYTLLFLGTYQNPNTKDYVTYYELRPPPK
jgi:hypothetical protein